MKPYLKWYGKILLLSIFLNIFIETASRKSLADTVAYAAAYPLVFVLNTLIIALPFTLTFIVRRKVFVGILVTVLWMFMGVINGVLLIFRTTPFTAADLRLFKYALSMLTNYLNWFQIILMIIGIVAAALFCMVVWKLAPVDQNKIRYGIGTILIAVSVTAVVGLTKVSMETGLVAVHFGNIGQAFRTYGFPYCFSNSLLNTGISKPEDYGVETIEAIQEDEMVPDATYVVNGTVKPNIIMIQLESFFDPALWKNNPVEEDPIPFFHYLTQAFPTGYLNVPSVGAGTANTEFEVITGMNLDFFGPGEYPYKTVLKKTTCESVAFDLKNLGYTAHAIHNNEATFYDRNYVFSQLGFDTFIPIEYMYNIQRTPAGWCKDKILTGEIVKALDSTVGSDLVYAISVQGHGAYPSFQYYCDQINEMDQFIRELVRTLKARQEPVALILYGDHLPGFEWSEEEMVNNSLYQTQYVIWNNMQLPKEKKDVEAYQLSAYVLNLLGIQEGTMMRFHQNHLETPGRDQEKYLDDMRKLEYDILYGEQEVYGGISPYESTDLKMGIMPIMVEHVIYNASNILVYGQNFNPYSKICLDGKPLETMYVWPELIIAKNVAEKKADGEVTVKQIGRDKLPLGEVSKE